MSAATKKPPAATATATANTSRGLSSDQPPRSPSTAATPTRGLASPVSSRASTPTSSASSARRLSVRGGTPSARAAMQRPGSSSLSTSASADADNDARAETVALLDTLRDQLRRSEDVAGQYQKQAQVVQARLDEAVAEQGKLEDRLHESDEGLETLKNEKRDALRQKREMEAIYEAERSSMTKEREEYATREEEMSTIIQRLKNSLTEKSATEEEKRLSRRSNTSSPTLESGQFAPPSEIARSDSRNSSKLVLQKDRLIESLRLELAEAQTKVVEAENQGGGRAQEVEKLLLEARLSNARLMEDNESFQLLLQEKTLNGEFKDGFGYNSTSANEDALNALEGRSTMGGSTLADELSDLGEPGEGESDNYKRLEAELKSAKDQNAALTLYINKIIGRLLQHGSLESVLDSNEEYKPNANTDKALPPPPLASGTQLFQRAKSVAMSGARKQRPQSVMPISTNIASPLEDPDTAPSIPFALKRRSTSYRENGRPKSDQYAPGVANVVNQMYKGGPASPPIQGPHTPRGSVSFFSTNPNAAARNPSQTQVPTSGNFPGGHNSERSSISGDSGEVTTPPSQTNSPPRSEKATSTFAGNKPRPLRLVQETTEALKKAEDEQKRANRASWMGWATNAFAAPAKSEEVKEVIAE